ncbi:MAG: 2-amino-4-hydroxy-6-hydroxymethyldihydropteridine diphosphokinase [Muribaculaceae bacterium]|nr:2-amino-4-hydroxy-6-hydroxymethyldihydropteridine diphosphokinase [Muribaculaceae bacterium]
MVSVVLSIGSNCGDRKSLVSRSIEWLKDLLMDVRCSEIYETDGVGGNGKSYMNAVLKGFYERSGMDLNDRIKEKERELGRNSECRERGDVPIDIDIVMCDGTIWKEWDFRQKFFRIGYSQIEPGS